MTVFDETANCIQHIEYEFITGLCRVNDFLPGQDLTIENALQKIPRQDRGDYAALYQWFESHSEAIGSRHYGKRLPGVSFPHSAQRGIHAPSGKDFAASVTVSRKSLYSSDDGGLVPLGDGTWVLHYSAHRNNKGDVSAPIWNQKLLNCLVNGVPVGLFLQTDLSSQSYFTALVFVEEFIPDADVFVLHGPVTAETMHLFRRGGTQVNDAEGALTEKPASTIEELTRDERSYRQKRIAMRQGQQRFRESLITAYRGSCAVSGCSVEPVLQAAHIIDYRGTRSNDPRNGLLLRSDIHTLFDRGLIGINPDTLMIDVGSQIARSSYASLDSRKLILPAEKQAWPREEYLAASYAKFKKVQEAS